MPAWSPDGQWLAFDVHESTDLLNSVSSDQFSISADGETLLQLTDDGRSLPPAW